MVRKHIFMLGLILSTSIATAQFRAPSIDQQLEKLQEQLTLTTEQSNQIKVILDSNRNQMEELRQESGRNSATREKMMDLRNELNNQIMAMLDEEQQQKFQEMNANRDKGHNRGRKSD